MVKCVLRTAVLVLVILSGFAFHPDPKPTSCQLFFVVLSCT